MPPVSVYVIADDGVISRHLSQTLATARDLSVDGQFASGIDAVTAYRRHHVDVILLDIGMIGGDPLTTIKRLIRVDPHTKIIMISTLTFKNVRLSMKGFERGAAEFLQTPSEVIGKLSVPQFQTDLLHLIRSLARARQLDSPRSIQTTPRPAKPPTTDIQLRPVSRERPAILAIGSSTGGPQALLTVLGELPDYFPMPIVITQHMPKTFTGVLASTLKKRTGKEAVEGQTGMVLQKNHIYVAPGDHHMKITGSPAQAVISLNQDPAINFCRPSVDPMVESIVNLHGPRTLLVILTGMGSDGKGGAAAVVKAGGTVLAQDFETSVVWGMPGAVAAAGYCSHILPVDRIGMEIVKLCRI